MIRVVVADDQATVRDGPVTLLGPADGIEVAGAAADGEEAVRLTAELRPDVVLMDLHMPRLDGAGATARIMAAMAGTAVLELTTYADDESLAGALRAGARGYLTKDAGRAELTAAVRAPQRPDRRRPVPQRGHREELHQLDLRQARGPRPRTRPRSPSAVPSDGQRRGARTLSASIVMITRIWPPPPNDGYGRPRYLCDI